MAFAVQTRAVDEFIEEALGERGPARPINQNA